MGRRGRQGKELFCTLGRGAQSQPLTPMTQPGTPEALELCSPGLIP